MVHPPHLGFGISAGVMWRNSIVQFLFVAWVVGVPTLRPGKPPLWIIVSVDGVSLKGSGCCDPNLAGHNYRG